MFVWIRVRAYAWMLMYTSDVVDSQTVNRNSAFLSDRKPGIPEKKRKRNINKHENGEIFHAECVSKKRRKENMRR